jgi:MYXO-CTERM domain-containing protein
VAACALPQPQNVAAAPAQEEASGCHFAPGTRSGGLGLAAAALLLIAGLVRSRRRK